MMREGSSKAMSLLLFIIFFVYFVESHSSVKRVRSIQKDSRMLYVWDGILTVLPFLVLESWQAASGQAKLGIIIGALLGSWTGCFVARLKIQWIKSGFWAVNP
jgi:hypothetical protein